METVEDVWITEGMIINIQSHTNTHYKFKKGLNVISADNQVGKSVFFKSVRVCAIPKSFKKSDYKDLVRVGCEQGTILFKFSDGSAGGAIISHTSIICLYTPDANQPMERLHSPHPKFLEKMGILVDSKGLIMANHLTASQVLLFVTSEIDTNTDLVQLLIDNPDLDKMKERLSAKLTYYKGKLEKVKENFLYAKAKASTLETMDVDSYEQLTVSSEKAYGAYKTILPVAKDLKSLVVDKEVDYDSLIKVTEIALVVEETIALLSDLGNLNIVEDSIYSCASIVTDTLADIEDLFHQDIDSEINLTMTVLDTLVDIEDLFHQDLNSELAVTVAVLDTIDDLNSIYVKPFDDYIFTVLDTIETVEDILESAKQLSSLDSTISSGEKRIAEMEQGLRKRGESVECPIYGDVQYVEGNCIPIYN